MLVLVGLLVQHFSAHFGGLGGDLRGGLEEVLGLEGAFLDF